MIRKPGIYQSAVVLALAALGTSPAVGLGARRDPNRSFVAGEFILYAQPGTALTDVQAVAATVNATAVNPLAVKDFYQIVLPAGKNADADVLAAIAAVKTDARVRNAQVDRMLYPTQNTNGATKAIPSDTLFSQQWDMNLINMPQAWVLQKGTPGHNVAVIDSGFDSKHPDLLGQDLINGVADGRNFTVTPPDTNYQPVGPGPELQHGVHVSGTIAAITNNNRGVAGIAGWGQNVKILPCRVFGTGAGTSEAVIAAALTYCLQKQNSDNVVAINMSLGGFGDPNNTTDILYQATKACADAGITVVCAAGNDAIDAHQFTPAGFPFVISVAATDRTAQKTFYTNFGKIEIAAPGGALNGTDADDILSTRDGDYFTEAGTSMACPHVAGVVALLRSVPGVTAKQVWDYNNPASSVLLAYANHAITGQAKTPDTNYGYGLLDAYAALKKVSYVVSVINPYGVDPATQQSTDPTGLTPAPEITLRPAFQFEVSNIPISNVTIKLVSPSLVSAGNKAGTITIFANGAPDPGTVGRLTDFTTVGDSSGANGPYLIQFRYRFDTIQPQEQEQIVLSGQPLDPTIATVTDTRNFTIEPHQFQSGISMVSFPIYENLADVPPTPGVPARVREASEILGESDLITYRWVSAPTLDPKNQPVVQGTYAIRGSTSDNLPPLASLHPSDIRTTPDPVTTDADVSPLGLGYFIKTNKGTQFRSYGKALTSQSVRVPIREGWNMIGDPFPFQVSFANLLIETPTGTRLKIGDAVTQRLILPFIYRFIDRQYTVDQLPGGILAPWEGEWIYVVPQGSSTADNLNPKYTLTLIVPPTGSTAGQGGQGNGRSTSHASHVTAQNRVSGPGSWSLQLAAQSGDLRDSNNFIGVSATAKDTDDQTKAPKPPMLSPYVSLGLRRSSGLYAQDLRALSGSKSWNVVVTTDRPAGAITISWPNIGAVPRNVRLTLTDPTTGQNLDMRQRRSYQFVPDGKSASRTFTVQAVPGNGEGRALITGLFVNPGRGRGVASSLYEIRYQISREASVDVAVIGPNGRRVSNVAVSRAAGAGPDKVYWNGQDLRGRPLPSGLYQVQVRAVTADGQISRMIVPMTLTGR